jgi:hypothetical protein
MGTPKWRTTDSMLLVTIFVLAGWLYSRESERPKALPPPSVAAIPAISVVPPSSAPRREKPPVPPAFAQVTDVESPKSYEKLFDSQSQDPAWSLATEATLKTEFKSFESGSVIVDSVDCRASICRVRATFDNLDSRRTFLFKTFLNPEDPALTALQLSMYAPKPDSPELPVKAILYLMRSPV